jgi:hypothetical protein
MRYPILCACLIVSLPVAAQEDSAPATCAELAVILEIVEETPEAMIENTETGCRLNNVFLNFGNYTRYRVEEIVLRAPGLFEEFAQEQLPAELDLAVSGLTIAPDTGGPLMSYIIEVQSEPMDIHLAYKWDRDARTVDLTDLSVVAESGSSFRFAGRFSNTELDPDRLGNPLGLPGQIDEAQLELNDASFFGNFAVSPLLALLPPNQDPRPLVENYKAAVTSFIEALPQQTADDASKTALTSLVATFPRLRGDLALSITAPEGLAFTSLAVDDLADIAGLLSRLRVTATDAPSQF